MGIQIVSVLAKLHSPLTSSSGVELQPRVDHRGREIALPDQMKSLPSMWWRYYFSSLLEVAIVVLPGDNY